MTTVNRIGFTHLETCSANTGPFRLNVIFVHGLRGHPKYTWGGDPDLDKHSQTQTVPRSAIGRLWRRYRTTESGKTEACSSLRRPFWPQEYLAHDIPEARIWTYGYNADVIEGIFQAGNKNNISKHGQDLAVRFERDVDNEDPTIFIAHSLGGILVKDAIRRSGVCRARTKLVIFLGTPHRGSAYAGWAETASNLARLALQDSNKKILQSLQVNGEVLDNIQEEFKVIAYECGLKIHSFQEARGPSGIKGFDGKIVDDFSSKVDLLRTHETVESVDAGHRQMARCTDKSDARYSAIVDVLKKFIRDHLRTFELALTAESTESAELNAEANEWLRKLYSYTCPYRERKERNPPRVSGTCEWFTSHPLFQSWQRSSAASFLWVSADPGCGKSVLAKYLADEVLPSTKERTTCYFFFKDDFQDQRSSTSAICGILHQIFIRHRACLSDRIVRKFEEHGEKVLTSFHELWDILISAATFHKGGKIVCVLDALDECEDPGRSQLIEAISKFYSNTTRSAVLNFLITSRPYLDIQRGFLHLEHELPTIHLSGENEDEAGKISREIDLVIRSRVANMLELLQEERDVLEAELTQVPNRTYLWVYLIFDVIKHGILYTPGTIRLNVRKLPQTVDEAYDKILSKSRNIILARKLLHIIVAAARPLTLEEMAVALAIEPSHRSFSDLELVPEARFFQDIRELCGLFVVVVNSKIYLLHQTARDFLVPPLSPGPSAFPNNTTLQWKSSLHPGESNRILAEICMWRLSLSDFNLSSLREGGLRDQYLAARTFLGYSAHYWADHFRKGDWKDRDQAIMTAVAYCSPYLLAPPAWFEIYRGFATGDVPESSHSLLVASYFGLGEVVKWLPKEASTDVNMKDSSYGRSALCWAARQGHEAMVRQLLEAGADANAKDKYGRTPLHDAARNGHEAVIQQLLKAGADANTGDRDGRTPLHNMNNWPLLHDSTMRPGNTVIQQLLEAGAGANTKDKDSRIPLHDAAQVGHEAMIQQLLKAGADANAKDKHSRTPLHYASMNYRDAVVQQLLEAGADTNTKDKESRTPLHDAAKNGRETVAMQLLEAGADANAKMQYQTLLHDEMSISDLSEPIEYLGGWTPLHIAAMNGHRAIVQQLLDAGADANAKDDYGRTPLYISAQYGHRAVVQQLHETGADAHAKDSDSRIPLHDAAGNGHEAMVQQLLETGANANEKDKNGRTPLHEASRNGHEAVVQQLLEAGADDNVKDKDSRTPLHDAAGNGHEAMVQQLLEAGANANVKDNNGRTPLHVATMDSWKLLYNTSMNDHKAVVRQLLEAGADANAKDKDGRTLLHNAARNGYKAVVQQLLEAGADANAKMEHQMLLHDMSINDLSGPTEYLGRSTPLHIAAMNGHTAIVQQLLDAGADANAEDEYGQTPLYVATGYGHKTVVHQLLEAGAGANARDNDNRTPLHDAAWNGHASSF